VVTGPAGIGKSTFVRAIAAPGDLVWDLDAVASVIGFGGREIPREIRGALPWPVATACLVMREALVAWLAVTEIRDVAVYLIVTDPREAAAIADRIGGTVTRIGGVAG
jgi:hypothetical protein